MHLHRQIDASLSVLNQFTPSQPSTTAKMNHQQLPGVKITKSGKFGASVKWKKKCIWLGTFNTPEEASAAILLKKTEINREKIDLTMVPPRSRTFAGPSSRTANSGKNREIDLTMKPRSVTFDGPCTRSVTNGKKRKIEWKTGRRTRRFARLSSTGNNSWARPAGNPELSCGAAAAGVESSSKVVEQEIGEKLFPPKRKPPRWLRFLQSNTPKKANSRKYALSAAVKKKTRTRRDPRTGKFITGSTKVVDIENDEESGFGILNGVRVIDKNGFLVGEFGKIDDLSVCWGEDEEVICLD